MTIQTMHPVQTLMRPGSLAHRIAWRIQRRSALKVLLILFTVSLIGWLYLTVVSSTTALNLQIEESRNEITNLEHQNAQIYIEIARAQSLNLVEDRARQLGFGPTDPSLYVYVTDDPLHGPGTQRASLMEVNQ